MNAPRSVVAFDQFAKEHPTAAGGKNDSLSTMISAGLPVPPGFAVLTDVFNESKRIAGADERINQLIGDFDQDPGASEQIRKFVQGWEFTDEHEQQIRESYAHLSEVSGVRNVPVAVRSSATAEDSPDASFAGEHDTYLWVRGIEEVLEKIRSCWASLFTDRAIAYREKMGYDHTKVEMAVAVQKMVRPRAAGVAFTLDPTNGDKSVVSIDSAWGFGEGVVSGEVTPDTFRVDKVTWTIVQRTISSKPRTYQLVFDEEGTKPSVRLVQMQDDKINASSLTDPQILAVAKLARRAEEHYGWPQDIEWAVDQDSSEEHGVVLLQARPETYWSQKKKRGQTSEKSDKNDAVSSIVDTLMNPMNKPKGRDASEKN
jgi:pyruvate,water dikinase